MHWPYGECIQKAEPVKVHIITHSQGNLKTANIAGGLMYDILRLDWNHRSPRNWPGATLGGQAWTYISDILIRYRITGIIRGRKVSRISRI